VNERDGRERKARRACHLPQYSPDLDPLKQLRQARGI
jgi:hypothetical protein